MKNDILSKALYQHTLNVDNAERRDEGTEPGVLTPGKDTKRETMLRRAIILITELDTLKDYFAAELKLIEHGKPARKTKNKKQERTEYYHKYFAQKGML